MEELIASHGSYVAIVLLLALTGAGLPLPEEIVIVAAGALSSPSVARLSPVPAMGACLAGALIGDCVMYSIGRALGRSYIRQHRWFTWIHADREERMERIVQQHGLKVFFLARFLVGVRAPIYLAMGVVRVDFRRFLACDAACGALVVGSFFLLSFFFGGWVGALIRKSQFALTGTALVVAALVGAYAFVWRKCRQRLNLDEPASGKTRHAP